jgi:hypothetical protein
VAILSRQLTALLVLWVRGGRLFSMMLMNYNNKALGLCIVHRLLADDALPIGRLWFVVFVSAGSALLLLSESVLRGPWRRALGPPSNQFLYPLSNPLPLDFVPPTLFLESLGVAGCRTLYFGYASEFGFQPAPPWIPKSGGGAYFYRTHSSRLRIILCK